MRQPAEPLGLLGGTFDPVHYGHLRLAEEARQALALAGVLWTPAGQPPHRNAPAASAEHRLRMVELAVAGNAGFSTDPSEVHSAAPSYTVPTLERLRAQHGARPLVLLLGADAFLGLPSWHRWRDLLDLAHVAVATRPGFDLDHATQDAELADLLRERHASPPALSSGPAGAIVSFAITQLAISASTIRAELAASRSVRYLLPQVVLDYIGQNRLYRSHGR